MTHVSEATLTLNVTLEEAQILAQALDLLASDPNRIAVRPPDFRPALAALGYAAFDLSSRVHGAINGAASAAAPSWVDGLHAATGR